MQLSYSTLALLTPDGAWCHSAREAQHMVATYPGGEVFFSQSRGFSVLFPRTWPR